MTKDSSCIVSLEENNAIESSEHLVEAEDHESLEFKEPEVGLCFGNISEMFDFYKNYAKQKGFPVMRRTCKKDDEGNTRYITLACSRSGTSKVKSSNVIKPYPNKKTGCKARMGGCFDPVGKWRVNSFVSDHNHAMSPRKARFFRCNRSINSHVKRQLVVNDRAEIRPNTNYNSCVVQAGGYENMSFLEKDCRNYVEKERLLRLGEGDVVAIQKYFMKMQAHNTGFFFSVDLDEEGWLKNVFWADSRSRAAYKDLSEVITFDTTYLTNKYDIPFASFVGVNHHGQSILFGCGLISNEDTKTFVWLFQTLLACMGECAPCGIITDQDSSMKKP